MTSLWGCYAAVLVVSLATLFACGRRRASDVRRSANGRRRLGLALLALGGFLVLGSPLDSLSDRLFSAHMVEHELFLNTIPLALLASEPAVLALIALRKLPAKWRRKFGRAAMRYSWFARIGAWFGLPVPALLLSGLTLWAWHVPVVYDYGLEHNGRMR